MQKEFKKKSVVEAEKLDMEVCNGKAGQIGT